MSFRSSALAGVSTLAFSSVFAFPGSLARAQDQVAPFVLPEVRVEAPKPQKPRQSNPRLAVHRQAAPPRATAPVSPAGAGIAGAAAREAFVQAPNGQTGTMIDRARFEERPSFSIGDILHDAPGISIKQGNGP